MAIVSSIPVKTEIHKDWLYLLGKYPEHLGFRQEKYAQILLLL
jgi:hypothetical protein